MSCRRFSTIAVATLLLAGCSKQDQDPRLVANGVRADIQIPIGEAASTGTYTIVVSMPHRKKQEITGKREGTINGRWVVDLTGDGVPEIIVWMTSAGSGSRGVAHVYQKRGDLYELQPLAELSPEQAEGYQGHDAYEVANGILHRRFPEYASTDPNASPSGSSLRFRYSFAEKRWVAE